MAPTGHLTTDDTEITISYAGADAVDGIAAAKIAVTVNKKDTDDGESIQVTVSYSRGGAFVSGSEGTLLSKAPVTVYDTNGDGKFTMSDASDPCIGSIIMAGQTVMQIRKAAGLPGFGVLTPEWYRMF